MELARVAVLIGGAFGALALLADYKFWTSWRYARERLFEMAAILAGMFVLFLILGWLDERSKERRRLEERVRDLERRLDDRR